MSSKQLRFLNFSTTSTCLLGFAISLYSFVVELKLESNPKYEPFCDISEHVSCSKAFTSEYGKGFGLVPSTLSGPFTVLAQPNSLSGMVFYTMYIFINMMNNVRASNVLLGMNLISNLLSLYLATILIFVLKDFCVMCVSIYILNAILLFLIMKKKALLVQHGCSGTQPMVDEHRISAVGSTGASSSTSHEKQS